MDTLYNNLRDSFHKSYHIIMLNINSLSLILGVIYFFVGKGNLFWNFYGLLMLVTFLGNIGLAYREEKNKGIGYFYLLLSSLFLLIVPLINTAASALPTNHKSQSLISVILLLSLFLIGGNIAMQDWLSQKGKEEAPIKEAESKIIHDTRRHLSNLFVILLSALLYGGLFLAINLFRKYKLGILEVFISEYALFFAIVFLGIGVLIIKLMNTKKYYLYYTIVLTTTIFIFMVCMMPFVAIPVLRTDAKWAYETAFGQDFKNDSSYQNEYFRQTPFSLPEYFFGTPSKDYKVRKDILFYQGTEGVDQGLELYYDVYTPVTDGYELPGGYSVLIRIHGGGWTTGDKGKSNFAQMNKYFAAQGYIVFDIQYGLSDMAKLSNLLPVTGMRVGDYTIDDMIRHIGIFTTYLAEHKNEYSANLNSVFLSGGSAGGQLALASGLAIADGRYRDIFDPDIKVKGIIPFYPANGLSLIFDIGGLDEFVDPIALVDKDSPPCLIYQGSHDGLVDPAIAASFQNAYIQKGNEKCAIITMPFGGHASDLYFSGYYNQVFLYYMERFLYQYR